MTIEKGNDLILLIKDERGNGIRVNNKSSFYIKVFTTDKNHYLEYGKLDVVEKNDYDTIYISAEDLATLESGVIAYTYGWGVTDANFEDGEYNKTKTIYTDFYFKNDGNTNNPVNSSTADQLRKSIEQETKRATAAENSLSERINAHTVTVSDNTLYITT